jgi:hypothetical protein
MVVSYISSEWVNNDVSAERTSVLFQDTHDDQHSSPLTVFVTVFLCPLQNSPQKMKPCSTSEMGSAFSELREV